METTENKAQEMGKEIVKDLERQLNILEKAEKKGHKNFAERIRETLEDSSYDVTTVKNYIILLAWGGPAIRIYGELDENNEPITAELQYQNWFTKWETLPCNEKVLLRYAQYFYFGE